MKTENKNEMDIKYNIEEREKILSREKWRFGLELVISKHTLFSIFGE